MPSCPLLVTLLNAAHATCAQTVSGATWKRLLLCPALLVGGGMTQPSIKGYPWTKVQPLGILYLVFQQTAPPTSKYAPIYNRHQSMKYQELDDTVFRSDYSVFCLESSRT